MATYFGLGMQENSEVDDRIPLYSQFAGMLSLHDSEHNFFSMYHTWDIAQKIRGAAQA